MGVEIERSLGELNGVLEKLRAAQAQGRPGASDPFRINPLTRLVQPLLLGDCVCAVSVSCVVAESEVPSTLASLRLGALMRGLHTNVKPHSRIMRHAAAAAAAASGWLGDETPPAALDAAAAASGAVLPFDDMPTEPGQLMGGLGVPISDPREWRAEARARRHHAARQLASSNAASSPVRSPSMRPPNQAGAMGSGGMGGAARSPAARSPVARSLGPTMMSGALAEQPLGGPPPGPTSPPLAAQMRPPPQQQQHAASPPLPQPPSPPRGGPPQPYERYRPPHVATGGYEASWEVEGEAAAWEADAWVAVGQRGPLGRGGAAVGEDPRFSELRAQTAALQWKLSQEVATSPPPQQRAAASPQMAQWGGGGMAMPEGPYDAPYAGAYAYDASGYHSPLASSSGDPWDSGGGAAWAEDESGAELGIGGGVSGEWDYDWRTGEWGAPGATTLAYSY